MGIFKRYDKFDKECDKLEKYIEKAKKHGKSRVLFKVDPLISDEMRRFIMNSTKYQIVINPSSFAEYVCWEQKDERKS